MINTNEQKTSNSFHLDRVFQTLTTCFNLENVNLYRSQKSNMLYLCTLQHENVNLYRSQKSNIRYICVPSSTKMSICIAVRNQIYVIFVYPPARKCQSVQELEIKYMLYLCTLQHENVNLYRSQKSNTCYICVPSSTKMSICIGVRNQIHVLFVYPPARKCQCVYMSVTYLTRQKSEI